MLTGISAVNTLTSIAFSTIIATKITSQNTPWHFVSKTTCELNVLFFKIVDFTKILNPHPPFFSWAISTVMSRNNALPSLGSGDGKLLCLIPLWDMINHKPNQVSCMAFNNSWNPEIPPICAEISIAYIDYTPQLRVDVNAQVWIIRTLEFWLETR